MALHLASGQRPVLFYFLFFSYSVISTFIIRQSSTIFKLISVALCLSIVKLSNSDSDVQYSNKPIKNVAPAQVLMAPFSGPSPYLPQDISYTLRKLEIINFFLEIL